MTARARMKGPRRIAILIAVVSLAGCVGERDRPLFKLLSPGETGVTFANTITTTDSLNVQTDVVRLQRRRRRASATSTTTDCRTSSSPATWSRAACT